jgi:hypothetical protein
MDVDKIKWSVKHSGSLQMSTEEYVVLGVKLFVVTHTDG